MVEEVKVDVAGILAKHGLNLAEDASVMAVKAILKALPEIVEATPNKIDDMLVPLLVIVEGAVLPLLDKIDGQVG